MRWVIRAIGLVVVLVAAGVAALLLIPSDRIAALAAAQFQAATGRAMAITGGVKATIWPVLGVKIGHVEIANASWSKAGPMLVAEGVEVGVSPSVLLGGALKVSKVVLTHPVIVLEKAKDGQVNWDFGGAAAGAAPTAAPAKTAPAASSAAGFSLADAEVTDGSVTWIDGQAGTKQVLSGINASLKLPDFAGPGAMSIAAVMNGRKVAVSGHVDRFGDFVAGKAGPATFDVVAGGSKIGFTGTAGMGPWVANGALDANLGDLAAVFGALGQPVPGLPAGLGAKTIAVKGQFTYGADQVIGLHKATLTLDSNVVSGDVTVALAGARPKVTADLTAGALNLASLGGGSGGASGKAAPASAGWSKAPIDASAMGAMDADVSLSAASLDLGAVKLGKSAVSVALAAGRAVVTLKPVTAYQGAVSGQVTVDGARGLSVASNLNISNMALQPLLSDYAGYKRLIGTANTEMALAGSGGSMDAIMHSLSGTGSLSIGKGEIQGLDLAGMLTSMNMNYMGAGAKTIFDGITASYTVKGGVLSNNDLSLKAPLLTASGAGTVNLGARTLDYTVTPTALQGLAGAQGVSVPLKISGPWAAPSFGLDMKSAVGAKIDAAKQKLTDQAKAAAAKAIADKLGGGTSGGTGNALQDKAAQGLMKLLGGN